MIFELRPADLVGDGLAESLRKHVEVLDRVYGTKLTYTADPVVLPADQEVVVFRIAQEALFNALRHAHATEVSVRLTTTGRSVVLDIIDNGVGFDATAEVRHGLGITSMRDRATAAGGTLRLESAQGSGTVLRLEVPGAHG